MRVLGIDGDTVRYEITGSVSVTLHYGSGSDTTSINENFPFTCTTSASVGAPLQPLTKKTEMKSIRAPGTARKRRRSRK